VRVRLTVASVHREGEIGGSSPGQARECAGGFRDEPHLCGSVLRAVARSGNRSYRRQRGRASRCQAGDMSADAPGVGLLGTRREGSPRGQGPLGQRDVLRVTIADDGIGGAEASAGSSLVGLIDRVEALGGRFALDSPVNEGTKITIELPLVVQVTGDAAQSTALRAHGSELGDVSTLLAAIGGVVDALYVVDAQGRIRFSNAEALRILGYEDERQLLGRPSHDTIHYLRRDGTPFPAEECPLLRPRVTGETVRVEEDWFVRQDRSLVPVTYSSAPISLPDGRGAVVSFRQISAPS
jgi:PAS domain S-box-containing protein